MSEATLESYREQVAPHQETYLGRLAWYTIADVRIDHTTLLGLLSQHGLITAVPAVPKDVDVFRRVSTNAERTKIPSTTKPGVFYNYLVRRTDERDEVVVRRLIVEEEVDKRGKRLSYRELYYVDFNRADSAITFGPLVSPIVSGTGGTGITECDLMCREILAEYHAWRGHLNSYAIRELIRRILISLGATLVRDGGGVYFLAEDRASKLESIQQFVDALPGTSTFHSLPLIDDAKQRTMVKRAFEAETIGAVDKGMADITEIMTSAGQISSDRYASILTDFQALTAKTETYERMLEDSLSETKDRLRLYQTQVVNLRSRVKI